jgi:hypothetical protein
MKELAGKVEKFTSSQGKRYEVDVLMVMCYFFAAWTPGTD